MTNNSESSPRYHIMARVRTIRSVRTFLTSPVTSSVAGIILVGCLAVLVSISDIFNNTMSQENWSGRFSYAFSSFEHSRFIVQTLSGLIVSTSLIAAGRVVRRIPAVTIFRKIGMLFGSTQQV